MIDKILKRMNLCRAEELEDANNLISVYKNEFANFNRRIIEIGNNTDFLRKQLNAVLGKEQELRSDLAVRDEKIAKLEQELLNELNRSTGYETKLKFYEDADRAGLLIKAPCLPGTTVYWVSGGFDETIKPYAIEFSEKFGFAIIELTVSTIIKNDKGCVVLMDTTFCINNIPSFHIDDFDRFIFTNLDDAKSLFHKIIENSTPMEKYHTSGYTQAINGMDIKFL